MSAESVSLTGRLFPTNKTHLQAILADLQRVNFAATKMNFLSKEDPNFKYHQAEVMVKTWIPLEYITNIHNF
jgi:hypothetical protein